MSELVAIQELLQSPETSATVIHAILHRQYGDPAYAWDIVTMMLEVRDDFKVEMASEVANRWAAIQTIMTTDAFFKRLDAFLAICNTLSTGQPYFSVFDPVTVEEAAWGISEVCLNRELLPFSYAIQGYVQQILSADGYDGDMPEVFEAVFDPEHQRADLKRVLRMLHGRENTNTVEAFIDDELHDVASQFDKIESLSNMDERLLAGPAGSAQ